LIRHKRIHTELDLSDNSHSNVIGSEVVDVKEQQDDIIKDGVNPVSNLLSSELYNDGHNIFSCADDQRSNDAEYINNTCEQMCSTSTSHETHTADRTHECELTKQKDVLKHVKRLNCDICNMSLDTNLFSAGIDHMSVLCP